MIAYFNTTDVFTTTVFRYMIDSVITKTENASIDGRCLAKQRRIYGFSGPTFPTDEKQALWPYGYHQNEIDYSSFNSNRFLAYLHVLRSAATSSQCIGSNFSCSTEPNHQSLRSVFRDVFRSVSTRFDRPKGGQSQISSLNVWTFSVDWTGTRQTR